MMAIWAAICGLVIGLATAVERPAAPRGAYVPVEAKGVAHEPLIEVRTRQPLLRQAVLYERASDEPDERAASSDTGAKETDGEANELDQKKAAWLDALQKKVSQGAQAVPIRSPDGWLKAVTAAADHEGEMSSEETPEQLAEEMKDLKDIATKEAKVEAKAKIPKVTVLARQETAEKHVTKAADSPELNVDWKSSPWLSAVHDADERVQAQQRAEKLKKEAKIAAKQTAEAEKQSAWFHAVNDAAVHQFDPKPPGPEPLLSTIVSEPQPKAIGSQDADELKPQAASAQPSGSSAASTDMQMESTAATAVDVGTEATAVHEVNKALKVEENMESASGQQKSKNEQTAAAAPAPLESSPSIQAKNTNKADQATAESLAELTSGEFAQKKKAVPKRKKSKTVMPRPEDPLDDFVDIARNVAKQTGGRKIVAPAGAATVKSYPELPEKTHDSAPAGPKVAKQSVRTKSRGEPAEGATALEGSARSRKVHAAPAETHHMRRQSDPPFAQHSHQHRSQSLQQDWVESSGAEPELDLDGFEQDVGSEDGDNVDGNDDEGEFFDEENSEINSFDDRTGSENFDTEYSDDAAFREDKNTDTTIDEVPKKWPVPKKHAKKRTVHSDDGSYLGGASLLDQEHILIGKKHVGQRQNQLPSASRIRMEIASSSFTIPSFDPRLTGPPGPPGESRPGPAGLPGPPGPDGDDKSADDLISVMAAACMIIGNLAMALCLASVLRSQIQAHQDASSYAKAPVPGARSGAGSISMSLTIVGVDFAIIEANPEANSAFELAIRNAIATECGDGSTGDNVAVAMAAGEALQVLVSASIVPASEVDKISAVLSQSVNLGSQIADQLDASVKLIVPDAIKAAIYVTDVVTTLELEK